MSDSVQPHRRPPTRPLCPWDSPGKNTGVGCHFLLQCMKVNSESEVAQSSPTRSDPMDCSPPGSSARGIFQAKALEWGAIAFSKESESRRACKLCREVHVQHGRTWDGRARLSTDGSSLRSLCGSNKNTEHMTSD